MRNTVMIFLALSAMGLLAAACGTNEAPAPKIVFMDNFKVFEEFEMKKEYDQMMEKQLGADQLQLDSMANVLNAQKDPVQIASYKKQFFEAKQSFDQRFGALSDQYTKEVYTRLNSYIQEYGKQKGYSMIVGSDGKGSVMYVDTTVNITADLITYINKAYGK
jgi:outer membrane protein